MRAAGLGGRGHAGSSQENFTAYSPWPPAEIRFRPDTTGPSRLGILVSRSPPELRRHSSDLRKRGFSAKETRGAPGRTRTCDQVLRSSPHNGHRVLYAVKLSRILVGLVALVRGGCCTSLLYDLEQGRPVHDVDPAIPKATLVNWRHRPLRVLRHCNAAGFSVYFGVDKMDLTLVFFPFFRRLHREFMLLACPAPRASFLLLSVTATVVALGMVGVDKATAMESGSRASKPKVKITKQRGRNSGTGLPVNTTGLRNDGETVHTDLAGVKKLVTGKFGDAYSFELSGRDKFDRFWVYNIDKEPGQPFTHFKGETNLGLKKTGLETVDAHYEKEQLNHVYKLLPALEDISVVAKPSGQHGPHGTPGLKGIKGLSSGEERATTKEGIWRLISAKGEEAYDFTVTGWSDHLKRLDSFSISKEANAGATSIAEYIEGQPYSEEYSNDQVQRQVQHRTAHLSKLTISLSEPTG
jgi:hypothetical protein